MTITAIRAILAGRPVSTEEVAAWETARLAKAAKKIGLPAPSGPLEAQRFAFAEAKLALGAEQIEHRLRRDLAISAAIARLGSNLQPGRIKTSVCDLHVVGGTTDRFVQWFTNTDRDDYRLTMLAANPDHFLIEAAPDGRQEVIETTGGSPAATHFFVDYTQTDALRSPRDDAFPLELAGVARQAGGQIIGGVRHQFRDESDGFHARLLVEFPSLTPSHFIAQHRWHLACEFSNWVRFAFAL